MYGFSEPVRTATTERAPDHWAKIASVFIFVFVAIAAFSTFKDYGIGWDSRVQATYGHKLLSFYLSGFQDKSAFSYSDLRFYGGFFDMLAAVVDGISPFGEYETRHLLGASVFVFGLVGAWRLTCLVAGRRAALIAVLMLATTPLLYGHAFINPKDSPFAWLLIWVTYFGCRILKEEQQTSPLTYLGFAITLGLALGTRVFAMAYLGYLVAVILLRWFASRRAATMSETETNGGGVKALFPLVMVLPLSCAVMLTFWPWAALGPSNFTSSVDIFLHFPHRVPVLWEGEIFQSVKPPASYLWVLLGVQLPEQVLLGLVIALTLGLVAFRRVTLARPEHRMFLFILMTAMAPLVAFTVLRPTVYNGLRQFLFIVPPMVIVAAVGFDRVLEYCTRRKLAYAGVIGLLGLAVLRQIAIMYALHPYEYVAFNDFTGNLSGASGRFELDYWGTSLGEASKDLVKVLKAASVGLTPTAKSRVFVCGDRISAEYYLPSSFQITDKPDEADFIVAPAEETCVHLTRRPMQVLAEVKRDGVVLSRVFDLRQPFAATPQANQHADAAIPERSH